MERNHFTRMPEKFATNSDSTGILTHEQIRYITGHESVQSLLNYIGKNDIEMAKYIAKKYKDVEFEKENIELKNKIKELEALVLTLQKGDKQSEDDGHLTIVS